MRTNYEVTEKEIKRNWENKKMENRKGLYRRGVEQEKGTGKGKENEITVNEDILLDRK